jgi:uncharacterized protein (DUF2235 family)
MTRRLVVCADGTWNTPDQEDEGKLAPTNVVKMYEAVRRRPVATDNVPQIAFYHEGVGSRPNAFERGVEHVAEWLHIHTVNRNLLSGVTGDGIDTNIKDCYHWLVRNYLPGDDIFLFGFSRGAYTVRSLAGFIRNCGLLKQPDESRTDEAFELYRDRTKSTDPDSPAAVAFRQAHSVEVGITCIGVWDTVGSLGIPIHIPIASDADRSRYDFHDVRLSRSVKFAFHALAIDERREQFTPSVWEQQDGAGDQVLLQTWFAGVHSNVGGGYADCGLSDTTFLWMAEQLAPTGLELDPEYVSSVICNSKFDGVLRDSAKPPPIWPTIDRAIAKGLSRETLSAGSARDITKETVHATALRRFNAVVAPQTSPWTPKNLADYLQRFP